MDHKDYSRQVAESLLAMDEPQRKLAVSMHEAVLAAGKSIDRLKELKVAKTTLEDWHEDLLENFIGEVGLNSMRLVHAHKERQIPILAYIVRNLLELDIWIEYCCKSTENARRFVEDKYRDGIGLHSALESLASLFPNAAIPSEIEIRLKSLESTIRKRGAEFGMPSVDDDYKRVIHAAGVVGMKAAFASLNAVLSKFAHPTALVVLSFPQGQALDNFCNSFLPIGASFSLNACAVITAFVQGLVPSDPGS